ncbi:hypothetical protein ON010_g5327 [Phytophthora cinnamomi]|nr:hypothetical protein ON010_g5327 [Phytophthora cinnamomi]
MAAQGGWSTKMRIQELKLKLSGAARDWFNQLPKHTRRDWKELSAAFRKKFCKARSSYSERYFTMEMKNSESALDFFYRLNSAAGKAEIDFRKSSKRLEKHIRRFITKLRDTRLKTSLQGQRFRSIADLEYALEQDEDDASGQSARTQDNQQCMATLIQDSTTCSEFPLPDGPHPDAANSDEIVEYKLNLRERYGWWEDHNPDPKNRDVAMVHGAVNDCRTKVLLDTGATVNIVSFDLARKLGLKLKSHKRTKVSGMGGVPTYIGASAEVKITLGPRVVYILNVWVANIGEGIDVLLGMSFMFAAGLRISVREGLVTLPDEETIVMCVWPPGDRTGVDLPVNPQRSLYLRPGEDAVVRIQYGQTNPQRELVWAGRGDRWVTQIIYAAKSWAGGLLPRSILRRVRFAQDAATQTDEDTLETVVTPQETEARTSEAETAGEGIVETTGSKTTLNAPARIPRRKFQRDYSYAPACAEDIQKKAKRARSDEQNRKWHQLSERLKKLAHLWHGPFGIEEIRDDFRVHLKENTGYRVNPWVHVSRLKPRAIFPKRPTAELEVDKTDDFDAALLSEDSWEPDHANGEFEVEKILDLRWVKRTRTFKRTRKYSVKWKGYPDPEWIPVSQLNCGALLYEFNQGAKARARFQAIQAGDDHPSV